MFVLMESKCRRIGLQCRQMPKMLGDAGHIVTQQYLLI